jgi:hypothetical protein
MRTKTLLLSALLGALGSVAVHAQTNVYSLNAVGYINITAEPGFNMISCPLIASPNNNVGTLLNNATGTYTGDSVFFYNNATGTLGSDEAEAIGPRGTTNADGWANGGTNVLAPGVACWFQNVASSNITLTFVGTVPSGALTNTLAVGYNMVGSVLPTSGDVCSNSLMTLTNYNIGDEVFVFTNPSTFTIYQSGTGRNYGFGYNGNWTAGGDPTVPNVGQGFWYQNNGTTAVNWVENYSVSQ